MPKCDICERDFGSERALTVHKNHTHSGDEKPYQNKEKLERMYWNRGMTQREIADELNTGKSTIDAWMSKLNVRKRDKSKSAKRRGMPDELVESGAPEWVYEERRKQPANLVSNDGYVMWRVSDKGTYHAIGVHRLVAIANGADPEDVFGGSHVHHRNGVKWDNRPENLEIMSKSEHHSIHNNPEKEAFN